MPSDCPGLLADGTGTAATNSKHNALVAIITRCFLILANDKIINYIRIGECVCLCVFGVNLDFSFRFALLVCCLQFSKSANPK